MGKARLLVEGIAVEQVGIILPTAALPAAKAALTAGGWRVMSEKPPSLNDGSFSYPATKVFVMRQDKMRDMAEAEGEVRDTLLKVLT